MYNIPHRNHSGKMLIIQAALSIILLFTYFSQTHYQRHPSYDTMKEAVDKMQQTFNINRQLFDSLHIEIDPLTDPLLSGYIGIEFSNITTTIGHLPAKQLATNPDFAALLVRWFEDLSLSAGEIVIIQASGSFPSLVIAAIISCESYGLKPIIFSSAGASSYGANRSELTYWDIENNT